MKTPTAMAAAVTKPGVAPCMAMNNGVAAR